jgi:hypothetical protein
VNSVKAVKSEFSHNQVHNFGVKKMTNVNSVEVNLSEMNKQNSVLNSAGDDSMSKKIYECRLRLDDEMHNQIVSILEKFEKSGMSQIETISFLFEVGMSRHINSYESELKDRDHKRYEVKGLCETDAYRKDKIYVNFVRKFNDSTVVKELFGVYLDGRVLEKMKNFTKLVAEILNVDNETIIERVLDFGIIALLRTENASEMVVSYEKQLEFRKYY